MRSTIIFATSLIFASFLSTNLSHAAALKYSVPVTISNPNDALTQFQVQIFFDSATLIAAGKMKDNCDDIRVLGENGIDELPYWLESGCNQSNTSLWVKLPSLAPLADTVIFLSYGDLAAISQSNPDAVFEFYDDFSGTTLDTSKWTVTQNQGYRYSVSDGQLRIVTAGDPNRTIMFDSRYPYSESVTIEKRVFMANTYGITGQVAHTRYFFTGQLLVLTGNMTNNTTHGVAYPKGSEISTLENYDHLNYQAQSCWENKCTAFRPIAGNDAHLLISAFDHSYQTSAADQFRVDWVRVRKYAAQKLFITLGEEFEKPTFPVGVTSGACVSCTVNEQLGFIIGEFANIDSSSLSRRDQRRLSSAEKLLIRAQAYIAVGDVPRAMTEIDLAVDEIIRMRSTDAEYLLEFVAKLTRLEADSAINNLLSLDAGLNMTTAQNLLAGGDVDVGNLDYINAINNFKRAYDEAYRVARQQF